MRPAAVVRCDAHTLPAAALVWLGVLLGSLPLHAAEKLTDHFSHDWYYTEVLVFQRPGVQDHASEEKLAQPAAPLPRSMRSFALPPAERWAAYRLDPQARAFLTFPYLDQEALAPAAPEPPQRRDEGAAGAPAIDPRLAPDPLLDLLNRIAAFEATLERNSYRWLEADTFTLTPVARTLVRRGGHQVILHGRWLQPVPPREAPEPLLIQGGPRYADTFALEGVFDVTRGRYLHFRAHLLYTEPLLGRRPVDRALAPVRQRPPGLSALEPTPAAQRSMAEPLLEELGLTERDLAPAGFMQMRESRRVREGELHYLDHPKLGVVVRIEPVIPPESLTAAYEALEQGDR